MEIGRKAIPQEEAKDAPPAASEIEYPRIDLKRPSQLLSVCLHGGEETKNLLERLCPDRADRRTLGDRVREPWHAYTIDHRLVHTPDQQPEPFLIGEGREASKRIRARGSEARHQVLQNRRRQTLTPGVNVNDVFYGGPQV